MPNITGTSIFLLPIFLGFIYYFRQFLVIPFVDIHFHKHIDHII